MKIWHEGLGGNETDRWQDIQVNGPHNKQDVCRFHHSNPLPAGAGRTDNTREDGNRAHCGDGNGLGAAEEGIHVDVVTDW